MIDILKEAYAYGQGCIHMGETADYIPQLAKVNKNFLGVCVTDLTGESIGYGDIKELFTIQSIVKIILLATAIEDSGFPTVFEHVGMEPTGDRFNSIVKLETTAKKPLNPMINAGAIAVTTFIKGKDGDERINKVLKKAAVMLNNPNVKYDEAVYLSEKETGDRNRSLAYIMKANGIFGGNVDDHLDVYFKACSILASCKDISFMAAVLANKGKNPIDGTEILDFYVVRALRSLMVTCGMYDASGEFALRVGLPAKSGVGGGIIAVAPNKMGLGVFGPSLDEKGNSIGGYRILEYMAHELELSIF